MSETRREGPDVSITRKCFGCRYEISERYGIQSDSGCIVYCTHPTVTKKRVADSRWDTPAWCPVAPMPDTRAPVESGTVSVLDRIVEADGSIMRRGQRICDANEARAELAALRAPPLSPATPSAELIAAADELVDAAGIALGATATTQAREGLRVAIAAYDAARQSATAKGN